MKKYLVLMGTAMAMLFASACNTTPAGTSAVDAPPTTAPEGANPSVPAEAKCTPVAGGIPTTEQDFDCLDLVSVAGGDATGELAWLGTEPFTLATMVRDGSLSFSSQTPCNTLMSTVKVIDKQFIVDPNIAMTMMACQSPQSDYETWVSTFFSTPLDYTINNESLILSGENGTVTFKPAAS